MGDFFVWEGWEMKRLLLGPPFLFFVCVLFGPLCMHAMREGGEGEALLSPCHTHAGKKGGGGGGRAGEKTCNFPNAQGHKNREGKKSESGKAGEE